jgi:hypothetical protein
MDGNYDINSYSDEDCFTILNLNNPSDRELEMSILEFMDKYQDKSKRLYHFFESMYDRFFDGGSVEDESSEVKNVEVEGFVGREITINEVTPVKKDDVQQVTQTDYVKDKFKLNPVKRNTIFKMISVDSQFREDASTTNASSFTMNLSESIDNVISMKLYSVQIPYTWYTINSSFGSNFFYLKGNSPGIDNGDHDIKIEIPSGNYTPPQFAETIQGVFNLYKTGSKDLSFGDTNISYNTNNTKILFEFDLKKKFVVLFLFHATSSIKSTFLDKYFL